MADVMQDPDQFVTVGKFIEAIDAQMAKGLLESAGIECFLHGENANSLLGAAFRARLQVHKHDEEAARQILDVANADVANAEPGTAESGAGEGNDDEI